MAFFLSQAAIRKELNEFKSKEMEVHEESKQFTRYVCILLAAWSGRWLLSSKSNVTDTVLN